MSDDELKLALARIERIIAGQFYMVNSQGHHQLWNKFHLTRQQVAERLVEQAGRCACCNVDLDGVKWAIDHKHGTFLVRGILCYSCNVGIGQLGDSIEGLMKGLVYLQRFEEKHSG